MNYCVIWIIALIVFVIIEAFTYQLITIWFSLGALGALICALAGGSFPAQMAMFFAVAVVMLVLLRPISMKLLKTPGLKTNADKLIGGEVIVTEGIAEEGLTGLGKIDGMEWTIKTENGEALQKGDRAVALKIDGVKLIVKKKEK